MGPYGVHWERTQTWWEMVPAYHEYLARCQFLLRRGLPVVVGQRRRVCDLVLRRADLDRRGTGRDEQPSAGLPVRPHDVGE